MRNKLSVAVVFGVLLCHLCANSASIVSEHVDTDERKDDSSNLFTVATLRMCIKAIPELKERLETSLKDDRSLLPEEKAALLRLQSSTDPRVNKRINDLANELYDKDTADVVCKELASQK